MGNCCGVLWFLGTWGSWGSWGSRHPCSSVSFFFIKGQLRIFTEYYSGLLDFIWGSVVGPGVTGFSGVTIGILWLMGFLAFLIPE